LQNANILVVGPRRRLVCCRILARAGVEPCVDGDVVDITNINRQLPALHSTRTLKSQLLETD
jgi:tRNA A37 threonylcarbamoyladenosine dehydratase